MTTDFPQLSIIASGGVASMTDIHALNELHLHGVIVGKAIYESRISLKEIQDFMQGR